MNQYYVSLSSKIFFSFLIRSFSLAGDAERVQVAGLGHFPHAGGDVHVPGAPHAAAVPHPAADAAALVRRAADQSGNDA